MMFMTAKVDLKKILTVVGVIALLIIGILWLLGDSGDVTTLANQAATNEQRVKYLEDFGWDVTTVPVETSQVKIPTETSKAFDRYCLLQKSNGFDLAPFAGKNVMRYVYRINNYPGATEPVYATLLVYRNQVIGGDITDTAANGQIRGFKMPGIHSPATQSTTENTAAATQ